MIGLRGFLYIFEDNNWFILTMNNLGLGDKNDFTYFILG